MEKKYVITLGVIAVVAILGLSLANAFPFGNGFMKQDMSEDERAQFEEQRQSMHDAIQNKDYASWKALMEEQIAKMQADLTEENFNKFVEMEQKQEGLRTAMEEARESGDFSRVQELREESGMKGMGRGMHSNEELGKCPFANSE